MRVILVSSSPAQRARMKTRLDAQMKPAVLRVVTNLTEAYHEAEHRPPSVAIFSEDLTLLPEFEVILALLKSLDTKVAAIRANNFAVAARAPTVTAKSIVFILEEMSDPVLRTALGILPTQPSRRPEPPQAKKLTTECSAILIGSSTGGVEALIRVLAAFPVDCPPVMLVQHTGGNFSAGLARLLNAKAPIRVCEAEDGMIVGPGMAVLAPGDRFHLKMNMRGQSVRCRLVDEPARGGHRPSVDMLFESGVPTASRLVAAILTGMGRDGAAGLLALKNAGARTFGQDEETSLVYGMPKVAAEMGAVEQQLPLDRIGPALIAASAERTAA